jgi:dGTPase
MNHWEERFETWQAQPEDSRTSYDVDYARIIHSASFRRLQGKTQILSLGDSDFYRTRLTHSLEVSQIATGLVRQLAKDYRDHPIAQSLPEQSLAQAISLTHDLGHPPFGHGGEIALNYCMRDHGGFEGNGQTLRILTKLEKFSKEAGSNLTRRALLGVLKYPASYEQVKNPSIKPTLCQTTSTISIIDKNTSKPPKCYFESEANIVDWALSTISQSDKEEFLNIRYEEGKHYKTIHKFFDCSIMDIADDIAYGVHDLEDSIALKLISEAQFREYISEEKCSTFIQNLKRKYSNEFNENSYSLFVEKLFSDSHSRKRQISRLVHYFITNIEVLKLGKFQENLLNYRVCIKQESRNFLNALKKLIVEKVIESPRVQHLEFKGQKLVVSVFEAFASDPKRLLPEGTLKLYEEKGDSDINRMRVICDHVSGMTDGFLLKTYDRLFSPRMGSIFDRL